MSEPGEQWQTDGRLQIPDAAAERWLRDAERIGGAAEAAVFGQCRGMSDEAKVNGHAGGQTIEGTSELYPDRMEPIAPATLPAFQATPRIRPPIGNQTSTGKPTNKGESKWLK